MSLESKMELLASLGFELVSQSEDRVIARKFVWQLLTRMLYVIQIRMISNLSVDDIASDRVILEDQANGLDPSRIPLGLQKGRITIAVYYAQTVDTPAREVITSPPRVDFARIFVSAALEESTASRLMLEQTPLWGAIYFRRIHKFIATLLEPAPPN